VPDGIDWELNGYRINIGWDYIGIEKKRRFLDLPLTHWHPGDELAEDIRRIGTRGNLTVVHKGWLADGVVYSGPKEACPCHKKWLFGKYYYISTE